ncbi:MAG: 50S ribosomal protein L25 [Candidatus Kapaibacterium sp.]
MNEQLLQVQKRETGKNSAKKLRKQGLVPGIFYIKGEDSIPLSATPLSMRDYVYTSHTKVIDLKIEGEDEPRQCVLKSVNFDPVTDKLIHFDLLGIKPGQKLTVAIPIYFKGQAPGVRSGGIFQRVVHKLKVTCLPKDLVEQFEVDISKLELGQAIHLSDIETENLEFDANQDSVLCAVVHPRVSATVEAELEAEAAEAEAEAVEEGSLEKSAE